MILWFLDRFGLPGRYYTTWLTLLHSSWIRPDTVQACSLHSILRRQLLTRHGSRKAPTWIPEQGPIIIETIDYMVAQHKPAAVVLASPESLACLGLHPDHATLHNLRGSVYWRSGVPHIAMLPMSAWVAVVSQREIGAANYGFESQDQLTEASIQGTHMDSGGTGSSRPHIEGVHERTGSRVIDSRSGGHGTGQAVHGDLQSQFDRLNGSRSNGSAVGGGNDSVSTGPDAHGDRAEEGDSAGGEGIDGIGSDDSDVREDSDGDVDGDGSVDSNGTTGADQLDEPDEETADQFFYEPVLSPVGRFALTADVAKLKRILEKGKASGGLTSPIVLKYR